MLITLHAKFNLNLVQEEVVSLMSSFNRIATTIQALMVESYFDHYVEAIESTTGFNSGLINRVVSLQISEMMESEVSKLGY